jgi:hypothetical protein
MRGLEIAKAALIKTLAKNGFAVSSKGTFLVPELAVLDRAAVFFISLFPSLASVILM